MRSLTLVGFIVASSVQAQEPPTPAAAEAPPPVGSPNWSIATGVGVLLLSAIAGMGTPIAPARNVPNASLTVERRLGKRASLMLGVQGTVSDTKNVPEVPPQSTVIETQTAEQTVLLAVGLRYNLLSEGAPIALTVHGILSFGYARQSQRRTVTTPSPLGPPLVDTTTSTTNGGTGGLGAGIAVERQILEQIALRLALGILQASYTAGRQSTGGSSAAVSGFSFGLALQPSLELRVYF